MNQNVLITTISTHLAEKPVVRVRIHNQKYIPCALVRCHFSQDWEDVMKEREYIYVEKDEVLLDACPGLSVEPDNTIALRGQSSIHPDDWNALRNHWLKLVGNGHWRSLDSQSPPVTQSAPFAAAITDPTLIERLSAAGADADELIRMAFVSADYYRNELDAVKERGYYLRDNDDYDDSDD